MIRKIVSYGKNCLAVTLPDEMVKSGYPQGQPVAWHFEPGMGWVLMKAEKFFDMTREENIILEPVKVEAKR